MIISFSLCLKVTAVVALLWCRFCEENGRILAASVALTHRSVVIKISLCSVRFQTSRTTSVTSVEESIRWRPAWQGNIVAEGAEGLNVPKCPALQFSRCRLLWPCFALCTCLDFCKRVLAKKKEKAEELNGCWCWLHCLAFIFYLLILGQVGLWELLWGVALSTNKAFRIVFLIVCQM